MGNTVRKPLLSLEQDLLQNPKGYSFEMSAKILCWNSFQEYGKEISFYDAPIRTISINSFHLRGTEIEKITEEDGKKAIHIERLTLAGLNAPLPTPYAEMVYNCNTNKDFSFGRFLNVFNARILGISYQVSKKRFISLQANPKQDYMVIRTLANFFGESNIDRKYSRLAYLFWTKEKSAAGLESVIKYLYPVDVFVEQLAPMRILNDRGNRLGHARLNVNSDLGKYITVVNFGIKVHIAGKDSVVSKFISKREKKEELKKVIKKYLGEFVKFSVYVKPDKVPSLEMGRLLGRTTWLPGKELQEAKII